MLSLTPENGIYYAGGVSLPELAAQAGTPGYVYCARTIKAQYTLLAETLEKTLKKALEPDKRPLLCFACKANSNLAVLSLLRSLGSGLEIVSEGELLRGLKAGFDPKTIVATGVGKQEPEIRALLEAGIHQINIESLPELARIQHIASDMDIVAPVVFRLNPDIKGGGHDKITTGRKTDKFGMSESEVYAGFAQAENMSHINPLGLSVHIGSQVFEVESFRKAFAKFPDLVKGLRAEGYNIERLDIGGGFPIRYKDEKLLDLSAYAEWVRDFIAPLNAEIILEPGRFLVGDAGLLLSKVLYVKETQDRTFLIIDAAMNDLMRPALYGSYHEILPVTVNNRPEKTYDIVGPVCESGDKFCTSRTLPEMQAGDLVMIKSAGAYGFSMASNYNTRPLPAEILVENGHADIIRPRQTYDDLIGPDRIPDWLQA